MNAELSKNLEVLTCRNKLLLLYILMGLNFSSVRSFEELLFLVVHHFLSFMEELNVHTTKSTNIHPP